MMPSRVRSSLQNCLTPKWLSPFMVSSKVYPTFSKNCPPHMACSQTTIRNTPCINDIVSSSRICCHWASLNLELPSQTHIVRISFLIILELKCQSWMNIGIVTFSLQLLQNIWITYDSHGYHPQLVLENWNIPLPVG